ncbi:MAG: hypothetical protein F6K03_09115 [Kamptonema sp. SIO4C4]|nr:hypothetical protein [Kamptonema sp. SIO4C4]
MHYSLLSRFQGGLLGGQIAGSLGETPVADAFPWSRLQQTAIAVLCRTGQLACHDWLAEIAQQDATVLHQQHQGNSAEVALGLFPLCLFFHDNLAALREMLVKGATIWLHPDESLDLLLLWGESVARSLQIPPNAIPMKTFLYPPKDFLRNSKKIVSEIHNLQQQEKGLIQVVRGFSALATTGETAIALALYCFSDTPNHFALCLRRAAQTQPYANLTTPLTGMIAGTYNGVHSLSLVRRHLPKRSVTLQAAQQLFQAWSGVYAPTTETALAQTAIAASGQIQPRSSLSLLSQRTLR